MTTSPIAPLPPRPTRPGGTSVTRAFLRLVSSEPRAYVIAIASWSTFFLAPTFVALLVRQLFNHLSSRPASLTPTSILVVLAVVELGRWLVLLGSQFQFDGLWEGLLAVQRANLLRSLALDPAPAGPRLPGAPGEAISRFRDDTLDLNVVCDAWIDLTAVIISTATTLVVLMTVDFRLMLLVAIPNEWRIRRKHA